MPVPISEFDIVFMSLDEPNADANYADLLQKAPWAKRIHGVYGSDACHKAAAKAAETDRFITVDADNIVHEDFFSLEIDLSKVSKHDVISWAGKNVINGLVYGNGGIKMWPKHVVEQMRTHEAAEDPKAQVDFCWDIYYYQMNNIYCDVHNNGSAYQAYRAGFREGVKLLLDGGVTVDPRQLKKRVHDRNYKRLLVWSSVGADVQNGLWAMFGARLGAYMTNLAADSFDYKNVRDFRWHDAFWQQSIQPQFSGGSERCNATGWVYDKQKLIAEIFKLGEILRSQLGLEIAELDVNGSRMFKESWINPPRLGALVKENQVDNSIN
jgi:hypothetical protein